MKARINTNDEGKFVSVMYRCPCGHCGLVALPTTWTPAGMESAIDPKRPKWGFNGDMEKPTFTPSVDSKSGHFATGTPEHNCQWCISDKQDGNPTLCHHCHSFVRDGRVQFLADCSHALAGQTVDLPEIDP
jgi:hypothetical protein